MNICFVSAQYLPTVGGVERYTASLAARLAASGHRAAVLTSSLKGLPARETDGSGVEIYRLPAYPMMGGRFPFVRRSAEFRRALEDAFNAKPDAVVVNNHFYSLSVCSAAECARRGVPSLMIEHGTQYLMTGFAPAVAAGRLYERRCADMIKKRSRAFYGVSKACSAWLSEFGIASNGEIYNAVDPSFITGEAKKGRADFRASLGLAADAPVISFSGRLIREKGVLQLAEALPGIRRDVPGAALLLAGDGPLAETLAGRHVRGLYLLGQLPYADSLALIAQSDVFCLPTRSEGFSGAVLEAAALGTPVITTATGGSPELIDSGESGILIPDMSAKSVETACARALSDREWRVCAAQKARARLLARFTWDRSAEALLSAVERLIKDNGDR